MPKQGSTEVGAEPVRPRWGRRSSVELVAAYEVQKQDGVSQRAFAASVGLPRSTLRHWLARKATMDADPVLVAFFESPVGLAFLHRLVGALHFVFVQLGLGGIDLVCTFLELTGLDAFVGASYGSQQRVAAKMTENIVSFGQSQRKLQSAAMPRRTIALAQDETFPEGIWLVAMEPASGFIVLEEEAANREAGTWTAAVETALADMWVTVAVSAGDEAAGLAAHANQIGAHHAPDLFHVQHPLWQALVRPLAQNLEGPAAALAAAAASTKAWLEHREAYRQGPRSPGRPPDFERHIAAAQDAEAVAGLTLAAAVKLKDDVYAAIRSLGTAYHPVNPSTGASRDADTVDAELNAAMATLNAAAESIGLSEKRRALIAKASRVLPKMVATITFFYAEIGRQLATLPLPQAVCTYAQSVLIPAAYLSRLAGCAATVSQREALLATRQGLLDAADMTCLSLLSDYQWWQLEQVVQTCVDLFARSTSCVEGRNGRLALWHHYLHRLGTSRLSALTTIHNYWIKRPDGSTAAERFFHMYHADLFESLLDRMDLPVRPSVAPGRAQAA